MPFLDWPTPRASAAHHLRVLGWLALCVACASHLAAAETAALSNLSVRTTLAANQTLIVGGVVRGGEKNILVRAGGPALSVFRLPGADDPRLALYASGSSPVATNDDWPPSLADTFASAGAYAFAPGSKDAALLQKLQGGFTVQAATSGPGTVLVEAYDVAGGLASRMVNLSARNRVGTGADILIAGFALSGTGTKKLLIRGVGPGLTPLGVNGVLADPLLRVLDSRNVLVASNDTWNAAAVADTAAAVGAFPLTAGSRDAALIVTLTAGATYTVQLSGADGGTGEALIEVYEVPDPLAEARLAEASPRGDVGIGFPRIANRLPSIGTLRFRVIFVDFSDAPAMRTPQSVLNIISPEAENIFQTLSYGRLNIALQPSLQWLRMSKRSTEYGWPPTFAAHRAYIQEALGLAEAAGVDFSNSDSFIVLANPDASALVSGPAFTPLRGFGVTASGKTFENGATSGTALLVWNAKWFNHEVGHTLALPDLYAFSGLTHRFMGDFSLMGKIDGTAPEYLAWERWLLGWLDDNQVYCPERGVSTVTLTPVETAGGLKMVVVPTGRTTGVVIENRQALGLDRALARPGPLVYFIDTAIRSGEGVVKVLPFDDNDTRHLGAPLSLGQTLTHAGVTVRYVARDGTATTLEVTRP